MDARMLTIDPRTGAEHVLVQEPMGGFQRFWDVLARAYGRRAMVDGEVFELGDAAEFRRRLENLALIEPGFDAWLDVTFSPRPEDAGEKGGAWLAFAMDGVAAQGCRLAWEVVHERETIGAMRG